MQSPGGVEAVCGDGYGGQGLTTEEGQDLHCGR